MNTARFPARFRWIRPADATHRPESPEQGSDDSPRALQTTGDPLWEEVAESLSVEPAGNHSAEEQVAVEPVSASANASGQQANETAKPRSKKQSGK